MAQLKKAQVKVAVLDESNKANQNSEMKSLGSPSREKAREAMVRRCSDGRKEALRGENKKKRETERVMFSS